jgi:uncharacterized membrane-anchored protein YhcB (DUF1043 family)
MKITKERVLYGIIIVLILWLIGDNWVDKRRQKALMDEIQRGNKMIVDMDRTQKEKDGQYAKLVDYFFTEKELVRELKEDNKELYKLLKKQDEKLLMLNDAYVSLKEELSSGDVSVGDTDSLGNVTRFDMALKYPNDDDPFINWNGSIFPKTKTYDGKWSFGQLPLQVVLTETERGLWRSRLIGPEWLLVDSIQVKSLPPSDFDNSPEPSNWGLYLGGGYVRNFSGNDGLSIGSGVRFKNHNIIINGTTNGTVGFSYYYQFNKFKKKK